MSSRLYVGNLPSGTREQDLEDEFVKYGTLRSVWVARKPPGFGFVEFDNPRDAADAVRGLDNYRGWRVEHSRNSGPKWEKEPGHGGYRGGYSPRRRSPRRSPSYDRRSPSYDRRRRSPSPYRGRGRDQRGRYVSRSPRRERDSRDRYDSRSPRRRSYSDEENGRSP